MRFVCTQVQLQNPSLLFEQLVYIYLMTDTKFQRVNHRHSKLKRGLCPHVPPTLPPFPMHPLLLHVYVEVVTTLL